MGKRYKKYTKQDREEVIRLWSKSAIYPLHLLMQFKRLNIIKRHAFDKLIKSYEKVFLELFKQFEDINRKINELKQKEEKEKDQRKRFTENLQII